MADDEDAPLTLAELRARSGGRRRGRVAVTAAPEAEEQLGLRFLSEKGTVRKVPRELPLVGAVEQAARSEARSPEAASLVAVPHPVPARSWSSAGSGSVHANAMELRERLHAPVAEPHIWGVRAIVNDLRERVETAHRTVLVEGEISTCRPASSGHLYLTLKEGETQLPAVVFRRNAQMLRFRPAPGLTVLARGRLSVFESRGELQLLVDSLEPRGTGALLVAFERLKERLAAEGLFESARKRSLPGFPRTLGIVTSTGGAVLHDIVTVVRRRHGALRMLVYPAPVQGAGCAESFIAGVRWFNQHPESADIILLARGGGSPEDLCGFNDEGLARAIAASMLPVVSAIGHETDFTIADFVADLRAPTPSAAAEIITERQHQVEERLERLEQRLRRAARLRLLEIRQRFAAVAARATTLQVQRGIDRRGQRLDELARRAARAVETGQRTGRGRLERLHQALMRQRVDTRLRLDGGRVAGLRDRLWRGVIEAVARRRSVLDQSEARLQALSPVAVLARGYALVYAVHEGNGSGEEKATKLPPSLIRSSHEVAAGQQVRVRLGQGSLRADVTETDPE